MMKDILDKPFYLNPNVCDAANRLIGKELCVRHDDMLKSGIITETEAYAGINDKASHAYNNRRTKRTEVMFREGGIAYVYLCYGIHSLFNVVTNKKDIPDAVLVRAVFPAYGVASGNFETDYARGNGPGKISKLLGIQLKHNGSDLSGNDVFIRETDLLIKPEWIITGQRIGVDYAGDDALLTYRFFIDKSFQKQLFT